MPDPSVARASSLLGGGRSPSRIHRFGLLDALDEAAATRAAGEAPAIAAVWATVYACSCGSSAITKPTHVTHVGKIRNCLRHVAGQHSCLLIAIDRGHRPADPCFTPPRFLFFFGAATFASAPRWEGCMQRHPARYRAAARGGHPLRGLSHHLSGHFNGMIRLMPLRPSPTGSRGSPACRPAYSGADAGGGTIDEPRHCCSCRTTFRVLAISRWPASRPN